jgi:hypothetical protein
MSWPSRRIADIGVTLPVRDDAVPDAGDGALPSSGERAARSHAHDGE